MKKIVLLSFAVLTFSLFNSCISTSEVKVDDNAIFPTVSGSDLQGNTRTLPQDLTADKTILVVAYQRWQQSLCDEWYKPISLQLESNKNIEFFEVPTITKMNAFSRWFIYRGMRGGITDPEMRKRVVTLHIDKAPFNKALDISSEETVYVFVLDKEGRILCKVDGKYSDEKWQKIVNTLDDK